MLGMLFIKFRIKIKCSYGCVFVRTRACMCMCVGLCMMCVCVINHMIYLTDFNQTGPILFYFAYPVEVNILFFQNCLLFKTKIMLLTMFYHKLLIET